MLLLGTCQRKTTAVQGLMGPEKQAKIHADPATYSTHYQNKTMKGRNSHGKVYSIEKFLKKLCSHWDSGSRAWVKAKAGVIAVGGAVVVARTVKPLAHCPKHEKE